LRSADDMLISESEASRAYLEKSLGYDARKLLVIRNGLEPRPEPSPADRERRRRELGVSAGEILVGTVGRLDEQKGHAYLLEALARLGAVHPVAGVFVGSGPLEARLKRLAASLGLENRVRFVGEQPETASWLGAMDVFALPSLWEGLPNSLLEAMAAGLPIVATRVDGVPEAVEDGSTALLCAPGDSQALCDRMQELVLDPDLRRGLGTAAKEAAARFDIPGMIAAYEDAYAALTR